MATRISKLTSSPVQALDSFVDPERPLSVVQNPHHVAHPGLDSPVHAVVEHARSVFQKIEDERNHYAYENGNIGPYLPENDLKLRNVFLQRHNPV